MIPKGGDIMFIECKAKSLEPAKYEDRIISFLLLPHIIIEKPRSLPWPTVPVSMFFPRSPAGSLNACPKTNLACSLPTSPHWATCLRPSLPIGLPARRDHSPISNILLLQSCYIIVTILLCLANTNKNKEDETMCFHFNSCSELFTALCKYFNLGC